MTLALAEVRGAVDLLVVGAGPSGMAASLEARARGLDTLLVDENEALGGQIYRAIGRSPVSDRGVLGADYWAGEALAREVEAREVPRLQGGTVWTVERPTMEGEPFAVGLSARGSARMVASRAVFLATGAIERPFSIPGWTLPGVMSAGAAQTALKASGLVPDGPVILAGCGPLLYLLAWQYRNAGVRLEALLDTAPRANWRSALPHAPAFLASRYARKGAKLLLDVARSTRVTRGVTALRAEGEGRLRAVAFRHGGAERRIEAGLLLLHQGVVPGVNLSLACGLDHDWNERQLCFRPVLDRFGEGSVPGVFVTGDGGAIGGADAAPFSGRLAALGAAHRLGRLGAEERDAAALPFEAGLRRAGRGRAFLDLLYLPSEADRIPPDDETIVCRCEEVTAGRIRRAVALGATGPNGVKSFERCGMGPCQGRMCALTVTEVIAQARGLSPTAIGHLRIRPPIKPITLAELASMPKSDEALRAVVRE